MNDSSTGGILLPINDDPINDAPLDLLFQTYCASITGLALRNVRERFTGEPATPPDYGASWAAVGVMGIQDDQYPQQDLRADGSYAITRHEMLDVLCSFYGPRAQAIARMARDTILIAQNREPLDAAGIAFMSAGQPIKAPALIQSRWTNRIDVTFTFRRAITEIYAILPVARAVGAALTDGGLPATFDTPST